MVRTGAQQDHAEWVKPKSHTAYGVWCDFLRHHRLVQSGQMGFHQIALRLRQLPYLQGLSNPMISILLNLIQVNIQAKAP
jgi:hypothetical protein